jgi:hypothetical protein
MLLSEESLREKDGVVRANMVRDESIKEMEALI